MNVNFQLPWMFSINKLDSTNSYVQKKTLETVQYSLVGNNPIFCRPNFWGTHHLGYQWLSYLTIKKKQHSWAQLSVDIFLGNFSRLSQPRAQRCRDAYQLLGHQGLSNTQSAKMAEWQTKKGRYNGKFGKTQKFMGTETENSKWCTYRFYDNLVRCMQGHSM